jgi:dienelactone hydrolase
VPGYDPFAVGEYAVGEHRLQAHDAVRNRTFPVDIWYPEAFDQCPLIVYSHSSGGNRRSSSFLCRHLASHGYLVAALDHSELVAPELKRRDGETDSERAARVEGIIASRVPDIRFLIDYLYAATPSPSDTIPPPSLSLPVQSDPPPLWGRVRVGGIGLVGHSAGGWTALATPEVEPRIQSIVAMVPGGSSHPKPGILPVTLTFAWGRAIPTLYLAAQDDVMIPLDRIVELFDRTPEPKRMFSLRGADHQHFIDDVEGEHEALRAADLPGDAAWIPKAMRPISELATGEQAHFFIGGLTLAHFDATLRGSETAMQFLDAFPRVC